jgi:uncharacterized protein YndB with AHSA1/START domain
MPATERAVSSDIVIDADPATIFNLLADPSRHPQFDGSGTVKGQIQGPSRLYLGAKFAMRMRIGAPYLIRNRVVEYDENHRIAWRHFGRHVWRYELTPTDGGTHVSETFDYAKAPAARMYERTGVPQRNAAAIRATLTRLKALVENGPDSLS